MSVENNINRPFEYYLLAESSQTGKNIKFAKFPELNIQVLTIDRNHHHNMEHLSMTLLVNGNVITVNDTDLEKNRVETIKNKGFVYIFQGIKPAFEGPNETHLVMYLTKVPEPISGKPVILHEQILSNPPMNRELLNNPNDINALLERSRRYLEAGNVNEAIRDYQYILILDPQNMEANNALEILSDLVAPRSAYAELY